MAQLKKLSLRICMVKCLERVKPQEEFIVLCLEDCNDRSNATTRRVVMQIDPEFSKTVVF
ncbi:P-loop containing nucleoside triphosphate hydrolases superfamily protein [Artemisia annua]|uniref:P-loop containing nucleoside triphosphate hydrolases superfamily protein n=1 Tax=Artemisia annua TaxID=35608 RepID=A0A2U1N0Z2_ARTAN|nr:P-loop containing nucleoside triphosphate hydrolases superfamily protein [Artemisia annua]